MQGQHRRRRTTGDTAFHIPTVKRAHELRRQRARAFDPAPDQPAWMTAGACP
jgi:hypothetical protein